MSLENKMPGGDSGRDFGSEAVGFEEKISPVVEVLADLAREKVYAPIDMLSRVEDNDEFYLRLSREALYTALRYVSTEADRSKYTGLEEAVKLVLSVIEKRPSFAKELALKALARSMG